jgi:hypothetical protein
MFLSILHKKIICFPTFLWLVVGSSNAFTKVPKDFWRIFVFILILNSFARFCFSFLFFVRSRQKELFLFSLLIFPFFATLRLSFFLQILSSCFFLRPFSYFSSSSLHFFSYFLAVFSQRRDHYVHCVFLFNILFYVCNHKLI